jgi:hypothetical protein
MTAGEQRLRDAASVVEALRPTAQIVINGGVADDDPIRKAWTKAREQLRAACEAYLTEA